MQQSDLSNPNIKPGPDPLRVSDTARTPELSETHEPAYAADAAYTPDTVKLQASCVSDPAPEDSAPPDSVFSELASMPQRIHASNASEQVFAAMKRLSEKTPRIHCLTNVVTMNDVANILLAIGGSAIMAQDSAEAAQITTLCEATLLNTGTPSDEKFAACRLAGEKANELGHPVVLDPVGAGASTYRQENIGNLLLHVHPDLIRCNLEEALILLTLAEKNGALRENAAALENDAVPENDTVSENSTLPESGTVQENHAALESGILPENRMVPAFQNPGADTTLYAIRHGGVESGAEADADVCADIAARLANACQATVLISGSTDAVSDGTHTVLITGGDARITRITGSGCMLSAICAALLAVGENAYDAARSAAILWKQAAECAGQKTDTNSAGMGSFHMYLFDAATNLGCIRL